MNPLIRIFFALLFLPLSVVNGFAGAGALKPVSLLSGSLNRLRNSPDMIRTVDSFLSVSLKVFPAGDKRSDISASGSEAASSRGRICSCQILNLSSSNYDHRHIALLAEKTNHGSSADFSAAKNRIEKEKKQLKKMFFDKVTLVSSVAKASSCASLYVQLKSGDSQLQVYEILNADLR